MIKNLKYDVISQIEDLGRERAVERHTRQTEKMQVYGQFHQFSSYRVINFQSEGQLQDKSRAQNPYCQSPIFHEFLICLPIIYLYFKTQIFLLSNISKTQLEVPISIFAQLLTILLTYYCQTFQQLSVTLRMTITRMVKRYTKFLAFSIAQFHL